MTARLANQRGLTLTEVTIVMILAGMVMTGLVGFYLNSQATWTDGATQAIAQRELTLALSAIRSRAQRASSATVRTNNPDARHVTIVLDMPGAPGDSNYYYWWGPDSLLHDGYQNIGNDRGPVMGAVVECFVARAESTLLSIDSLCVRTAEGRRLSMGTRIAIINHGAN